MARRILVEIDPDEFIDKITKHVVEALRPLIERSRDPEFVDGVEQGKIAGLSAPTIERLRRMGVIPSHKIGSKRLYKPDDVIAALVERTRNGASIDIPVPKKNEGTND